MLYSYLYNYVFAQNKYFYSGTFDKNKIHCTYNDGFRSFLIAEFIYGKMKKAHNLLYITLYSVVTTFSVLHFTGRISP